MRRANENTTQRLNRPASSENTDDMLGERAYKIPGKPSPSLRKERETMRGLCTGKGSAEWF